MCIIVNKTVVYRNDTEDILVAELINLVDDTIKTVVVGVYPKNKLNDYFKINGIEVVESKEVNPNIGNKFFPLQEDMYDYEY